MSNIQIPNLPPAIALNGSEQLEGVQAGVSVRLTVTQLGTYIASQYPTPFVAQSPLNLTDGVLSLIGNLAVPFRRITAPGPVAMLSTDYEVGIDQTIGAAITVALPADPVAGQRAQVSDVKGDAETFNITVTGPINGGSSYVVSTNYGWVVLRYSGTQWNIIG